MGIATNNAPDNLNVRDGGGNDKFNNLAVDTWGYFWMVVNNSANNFNLYFNTTGDEAVAGDLLGTFAFRNGGSDPLTTFGFLQGTAATGGNVDFDDIYLDVAGSNLANPIPEPSTTAKLLGLAALGIVLVRRRQMR